MVLRILLAAFAFLLPLQSSFILCYEADGRVALEILGFFSCGGEVSGDSAVASGCCGDCVDVPLWKGMALHQSKRVIAPPAPLWAPSLSPSPLSPFVPVHAVCALLDPAARGSSPPLFLTHCNFRI